MSKPTILMMSDCPLLSTGQAVVLREIALGLHLCRFAETLESLTRDLMPNRLTDYLYGLAEQFNAFFRDCRVEGSQEQSSRLLLCEATAKIMAQGLHLLGLTTVDRM